MRKRKRQEAEFDEELLAGAGAGAGGTDAEGQAEAASAASAPQARPGVGEGRGGAGQGTRISPVDIQQRVFRTAFRGYSEREVDLFLDEVTEEMARLMAENRSLRDQAQRAEMRPTTPIGFADDRALAEARAEAVRAIQEARAEADRILRDAGTDAARIQAGAVATGERPTAGPGAVAAGGGPSPGAQAPPRDFIHRERTCRQNLAELIQSHAEAVRQDARRSRGGGPGPVRAEAPPPPAGEAGSTERTTDPDPGAVLGGEASALAAIAEASGADARAGDAALGAEAEPAAASEEPEPSPPQDVWSAPVAPQDPPQQDQGSDGDAGVPGEAGGTPEGAWAPEDPPELRSTEPQDAGEPGADEAPRVLDLEAATHTAPADAEEFAFDVQRGEAATAGGEDLLPWEAERPPPPTAAPDHGHREQAPREQPEAAEATSTGVRRFGEPARYAVGLPSAPPWETPRAPSATGEDREEERRSLRELFWGED